MAASKEKGRAKTVLADQVLRLHAKSFFNFLTNAHRFVTKLHKNEFGGEIGVDKTMRRSKARH